MIQVLIFSFWIGILLSISPCPLATNIASVSFLSRKFCDPIEIFQVNFLYLAGRMLAYIILAMLIISGVLLIPSVSEFLTVHTKFITAIFFLISGIFLLEIFKLNFSFKLINQDKKDQIIKQFGKFSAFFLGVLSSLAFCPISMGLFFGNLIPVAIEKKSVILLPAVFALGSSFIVILITISLVFGLFKLGKFYDNIIKFEKLAKKLTGAVLFIISFLMLLEII